ncbi:MAG: 4-alpha-glucanotransferase [Chloracidobacterium sp.]|uniref:4-alpha-glucanotransferase n=1 Tax=Chloracidobacterium validum TaxID=2821543 RepID=A0ABX8BFT4_9BACT|nr:4-alpha-glucanotransferase [Chloracidobacterium validum]QUW04483.1 4-alpha-glucanotransferase [Chloracidobacterium validum]
MTTHSWPRAAGLLLHPTSLPGPDGIGVLDGYVEGFLDFLVAAGQTYWQILPLVPTGYGDSPYAGLSAFAGNPLLIAAETLVELGLVARERLRDRPPFPADRVDYGAVIAWKQALLGEAFERFATSAPATWQADFEVFCRTEAGWLTDYAQFRAIKDAHGGRPWHEWPPALRDRQPDALASVTRELGAAMAAHQFQQWLFFRQWQRVRESCHRRGVRVIGDAPIFVAYDSADVWAHRALFKLDAQGHPTHVAGVPPDYFSATGQLWGNPLYDWRQMAATGFAWWLARMRHLFRLVDVVRLDHFRGFAACWTIPASAPTAATGRWVKTPGRKLFTALNRAFGSLPIIAEDLGVITPDVVALRDAFGFPGMRVLQFAFGGDPTNQDLPHNYVPNAVVYTGTHDNDTTVGWYASRPGVGSTREADAIERERAFCRAYLNSDGKEIHWDFIRAAYASVAHTAIVPMQDVLGLGSEGRMNLPASERGNWSWRCHRQDFASAAAARLRELAHLYGRLPG